MSRNARARGALHLFLVFASAVVSEACTRSEPPVDPSEVQTEVPKKEARANKGRPSSQPENIERHIDDASAEVRLAEEELERNLSAPRPKPQVVVPGPPPSPKPKPEPAEPPNEGCAVACKALASMKRSTDYLCKLAGESDLRCVDARERVRNARERVRRAACPCETKITRSFPPRGTSHSTTW